MIPLHSTSTIKSPAYRGILLLWLLFVLTGHGFSQHGVFNGVIRDQETKEPVREVNLRIGKTDQGTFTNSEGEFSLSLTAIPCTVTFSCMGYETLSYEITSPPVKPVSLFLQRSSLLLREVDIRANRHEFIFRDEHFSILDYEIMNDHLFLLVFRYQIKRAELILLSMGGDTSATTFVPELKPECLFKDFLGNIHYISTRGNAIQCHYNEQHKKIEFPFRTTYDSLLRMMKPFLFSTGDRHYFQEFTADGLGTNFGYYNNSHQKVYIQSIRDEATRKNYSDDIHFYNHWNEVLQKNKQSLVCMEIPDENEVPVRDYSYLSMLPLANEVDLQANRYLNYRRINIPIVKLKENHLAIFKFAEGVIEFMDVEGEIYKTVPITFHRDSTSNLLNGLFSVFVPVADWKWSGKIYTDEYYRDVYTAFKKNGMVQIRKIDLETGKLTKCVDIPFPFPEKINIYQGNVYFLNKDIGGEFMKKRLVKQRL